MLLNKNKGVSMPNTELKNYVRMIDAGILKDDADKLKKVWDFCDKEQRNIYEHGAEKEIFQQGYIIALRKVQWEINCRCSELSKFVTYDNVY